MALVNQAQDDTVFNVELNPSQFVSVPSLFTIQKAQKPEPGDHYNYKHDNTNQENTMNYNQLEASKKTDDFLSQFNKIALMLNFKFPVKDYPLTLLLKNQSKTDVRIYEVLITVYPKVVKAQLEMTTPARIMIEQNIPVINSLDKDCAIKVTFEDIKNGACFQYPHQFNAKRKQTSNFPLKFNPTWICESEGILTLHNPNTNDTFEYHLKGIGEDPLAEDHLLINCQVREEATLNIDVRNYAEKMMAYKVYYEMPYAHGESTFKVRPTSTDKYKLKINPILGGEYTGYINFTDENGHYCWYTLCVKAESSQCEKSIDLNCYVRRSVAYDIELTNPLDEEVTYKCVINGECLYGAPTFTLGANQTGKYQLMFRPLYIFKDKGTIAFVNEKLGETWFELLLTSEENPPNKIPLMKCELGKSERTTVTLDNPCPRDVRVSYRNTNTENFEVIQEKIIIPANSSINVDIKYTPSDLENTENGIITFETEEIGCWNFMVFGIGIPPTKFPEKNLSGS